MEDIKEFYDFIVSAWRYVHNTPAPAQSDNEAWEEIIDKSNELCREFTVKMADWLEYLRNKSME